MRFGLFVCVLALAACKWSAFDDLREEAWVDATRAPDNGSTNWGVALARSTQVSATGGRLTVLGTAESIYNEIEYAADGTATIAGTEQELGDLGVGNLEPQPLLLADPTGDRIALVTKTGPQQVLVLEGAQGQLTGHQIFGADTADAAAFVVAPGIDGNPTPQPAQPLVASVDVLFGTFYTPPEQPFQQPRCRLVDGASAVTIRALAAVRLIPGAPTDDVVVWSASGKLYVVSGQVFNGARSSGVCPDGDGDGIGTLDLAIANGGGPVPQVDVGFGPDLGSQILVLAGQPFAVLQGHNNQTGASLIGFVDLQTMMLVGNPQTETGLKTAALFEAGETRAVVAGYPGATIDSQPNAGKVVVYGLDLVTGLDPTPLELLHDAQPDDGQAFGRALAVLPFNGQQIIAVGANNEVFAYFRTAALYNDDARQGR